MPDPIPPAPDPMLHQRLLAELDGYIAGYDLGDQIGLGYHALRAVVERHTPTTDGTHLPACSGCSTHDGHGWVSWVAHPCGELQLIARELGIDGGDRG